MNKSVSPPIWQDAPLKKINTSEPPPRKTPLALFTVPLHFVSHFLRAIRSGWHTDKELLKLSVPEPNTDGSWSDSCMPTLQIPSDNH